MTPTYALTTAESLSMRINVNLISHVDIRLAIYQDFEWPLLEAQQEFVTDLHRIILAQVLSRVREGFVNPIILC